MLRRVFQIASVIAALVAVTPANAGLNGFPFRVQTVLQGGSPGTVARLVPNAAWSGTAGSSGGSAPVMTAVQAVNVPNAVNSGGGDGIAYGAQSISAVALDAAFGVPQITVPSTAIYSEGDEYRVDGTLNNTLDGQWRLHIPKLADGVTPDPIHVDLCDNLDFSGAGTGQCKLSTVIHPSISAAYSGSGGSIWYDETPAAHFDEANAAWIEQGGWQITVGAAINNAAGIHDVKICMGNGQQCIDSTQQTISPTHNTFGFSTIVASRGTLDQGGALDGIEDLYAVITPNSGFQRVLKLPGIILNTNKTIPHPTFYVDNTFSGASDVYSTCDGTQPAASASGAHCPWKTLACAATYSVAHSPAVSGPVIHVMGIAGTNADGSAQAGTEYMESGVSGCTNTTSDYTLSYVADGPVYVTNASSDQPTAASGHNTATYKWYVPAKKVVFTGPFRIDTEFTSPYMNYASDASLLFGNGTAVVAAGGPDNTYYGVQGKPYGYVGSQEGSPAGGSGVAPFLGLAESTINSNGADGFNFIRNVTGQVTVDILQMTAAPQTIFNYNGALARSNVNRRHSVQTLTITNIQCKTNFKGANTLDITFDASPWDVQASGYPPVFLTMVTGNAAMGIGSPYTKTGDANVYRVDEQNDPSLSATYMDASLNAGDGWCSGGVPTGKFLGQVGDKGFIWYESHPDSLQTTAGFENGYVQNYEIGGRDIQPALFQNGFYNSLLNGGNTLMTTSGRTFTFSPFATVHVGDFIGTVSGAKTPLVARRIQSINTVSADFVANYMNAATINVTQLQPNSGPILVGMELINKTGGYDVGRYITSQASGTTGGVGVYNISSTLNQGTQNVALLGSGVSGGTLTQAFPVDETTPTKVGYSGLLKDFACVNCLFDALAVSQGLQLQWQAAQRHVFFLNSTVTSLYSDAGGGNVFHGLFRNGQQGYTAEASGHTDSVGPAYAFDSSTPGFSSAGAGSLKNFQATDSNGGLKVTDGQFYVTNTSFAANFLGVSPNMLIVDDRRAANVPFDFYHFPRTGGSPVGAVVH